MKILIVEDHKTLSESLKLLLEKNQYEVILSNSIDLAYKILKSQEIDLVISDIELPESDGVTLFKKIKEEIESSPKTIALTTHFTDTLIRQLYNIGVDGYLNKSISSVELLSTIRKVLNNERVFPSSIFKNNINSHPEKVKFTPRELDVLKLIFLEKTTSQIAEELNVAIPTVEGHRKNLLQKTGSKNVVGLIKYSLIHKIF